MNRLGAFFRQHPRLASWLVLSLGMVVMLLIAARDKGLAPVQLVWMLLATVGLAGACAWIISWE